MSFFSFLFLFLPFFFFTFLLFLFLLIIPFFASELFCRFGDPPSFVYFFALSVLIFLFIGYLTKVGVSHIQQVKDAGDVRTLYARLSSTVDMLS